LFAMLHGKALNSCLVFFLLLFTFAIAHARSYPRFSRNDTEFQHLVLHPDPAVGTVYLGARNHLFQLDGSDGLRLEQEEITGPVSDSKDCLPPVTESNCPQARRTINHNKLLLVDPKALELITCGSVHQGTCQKRSLGSIKKVLFSTERPVDTQYVAANDPSVSTVGLVVGVPGGQRTVMYVGRGYTANHPPISTRHLSSEPIFSYEETAKLAVAGRLSEYDHNFITAFTRRSYVYFLFYRRDIKSVSRDYRTYVARVCLEDTSYYSYVEIPLVCQSPFSPSMKYNVLQAAQVGHGAGHQGEDLLGVFSTRTGSTNNPLDSSALCVFPLDELDRHIDSTRDLCYTQDGWVEGRGEVAYIEYEVKSSCANLPLNTLNAYPCGSDHTPSPMASKIPLEAKAVWQTSMARLTAVAVSVREGHSIAFLGDARGNLHKVYLGKDGAVVVYANSTIQPNSPINSDLLLDDRGSNIYIMTKTTVEKRPVAECGDHLDCQSCLSARDPYCGWCVLEGRCGQRWECQRGSLQGQWLWSFNQTQQCLSIQRLSLYNISRGEKADIALSVEGLPSLQQDEAYSCFFQDTETPALLTTTGVICSTPDASNLPPIGLGDEFVTVPLALRFINVTVAETEFTFYNCSLVQELSGRRPTPTSRSTTSHFARMSTQASTTQTDVATTDGALSNIEGVTREAFGSLSGFLEDDDTLNVTDEMSHTTLPTSTNGHIDSLLRILDLSGEAMGSTLEINSTTFIEVAPLIDPSISEDEEAIPLSTSEENVSPPGLNGWAKPEKVTEMDSEMTPSVARVFITTQSLETVVDVSSESPTNLQSDSSSESFTLECPCVERVQDSSLLPVNVERKITLVGQHLNLFQDEDMEYECVLDMENQSVVVEASVEPDAGQPSVFFITCQPHQYVYSLFTEEYSVMINVRRKNNFLIDSAENLHVTLFNCSVGRTDCSRCRTADPKYGCVWCGGAVSSSCMYRDSCTDDIKHTCPAPVIHFLDPVSGPIEGGTVVTISGSNLGQRAEDIESFVTVAGVPCNVIHSRYEIKCLTRGSNRTGEHSIMVRFGGAERHLQRLVYHYTPNPNITKAAPSKSFLSGGRIIKVDGHNLDVVQEPKMRVTLSPPDALPPRRRRSVGKKVKDHLNRGENHRVRNSTLILCPTPAVGSEAKGARVKVHFLLDSLHFDFSTVGGETFSYEPNPKLFALNRNDPSKPYHHKPGSIISVEGENLDLAMYKQEVEARIGGGSCVVKTLTHNHLYCEPPAQQPSITSNRKQESMESLPDFTVKMGNLNFSLGRVQYDIQAQSTFPLEAQVGVGVGASIVALIVLIIVLIYRDRAYVASLLTVALHGKLEYFTDILKTLLNDLVEQYVAKNPKLMLRRAIKHQVDKGPVDAVTGKAKYTLNDNRLLREDVEYRTLTSYQLSHVLMQTLNVATPTAAASGGATNQTVPAKVLDCDTITQVKEKVLEQSWKGMSFSQRPHVDSLHLG
ncbi:hypothetical protein GOODEAATRI_001633, partial [Goodea atripinnis]